MTSRIENVRISDAEVFIEDHDILTAFVNLEGSGWGVGFGGYALDEHDRETKGRAHNGACGLFIRRVLEVVGVRNWSDLKGQNVRADMEGPGGRCLGIGHIYEDRWFYPTEEFKRFTEGRAT